ncbi:hypothetical protein [Apilactobacillus ozensis]|uniref:Uncharacterized protein n=1 Tax=Apilactobacillus ozensis DSM 23829 = JCM 17196 TaxID=1423781 RepID=A0A0R2AU41_9LACO|nr:hypothetical protein [Apilactobacillus ozensis]KRM69890.1 hypothetical protein FD06_GL000056 [Apilactobacillus ozensis DSM 23829 = JCM 17196]MCK8606777.1 hypothetical protein [Apilactobacillus ozensis]
MTDKSWFDKEVDKLKLDEVSFTTRSILERTKFLVREQDKRIQQLQDELDGRTWSPDKW